MSGRAGGPEGVQLRVRGRRSRSAPGTPIPPALFRLLLAASAFYVVAHIAIVIGVWPVHGTAPNATGLLVRDGLALFAWGAMVWGMRRMGYLGSWAVVILPVVIFLIARPSIFHTFTDPVYQAIPEARAEANAWKADRARFSTALRAYDDDRLARVFGEAGPPEDLPLARPALEGVERDRPLIVRLASYGAVFLAPLAIILGFLLARRPPMLRAFRERKRWPFGLTVGLFLVLALFFVERGRVLGTTPWELFLPIFAAVWAAVLADDSYNLGRMGAALRPRRIAGLLIYGAIPLVPFLLIRELGLSVVLAGTLAVMLLVGTRRGWWAGLMLAVWAILVVAAFQLDDRSATRLALAYDPYHDPSAMTEVEAEQWAIRLHQFKLFDANVLAGGLMGRGPGKGHPETAPNAADDGFITLFAAQFGLFGALVLVLLYTVFLIEMLMIAQRERSAFERSLITGLALLIAIPFWMAILGGIRVIPLTGVVAAFAAHGGTKLLASALSVGIIAGISHRRLADPRGREASDEQSDEISSEHGVRIR